MEVKSDLSKVRVGDELVSLRFGKVVVKEIYDTCLRCCVAPFKDQQAYSWAINGRFHSEDLTPDLYWPGVCITPAEPPKRMRVEKKTGYINIYPPAPSIHRTSMAFPGGTVFPSREYADSLKGCGRIGEAIEITWEIEVEDEG